jgi:glutamine amidotransferase
MCRLYAFRSSLTSGVHASLVAAENALAIQSMEHPDGWGVAYYHGSFPHLIRSDKQALADGLFRDVSAVVTTRTLLAHIRQATVGSVGILNCHPFQHGPWTFGHNGQVAGFAASGARVRARVDPRFQSCILGSTDSEVCFFLFLSQLARRVEDIYHEGIAAAVVADALRETWEEILEHAPEREEDPNRLTFVLTNGRTMLAACFRRPLHFSTYKTACPERGTCFAYESNRCEAPVRDGIVKHLIVSSEQIAQGPNVWQELQDGEYVAVDYGMNFCRGRLR